MRPRKAKPTNKCDSCGWTGSDAALKPIKNLSARVDAGGEVPSGECPKCGALAYIIKKIGRPQKQEKEKLNVVLHVYMTQEEATKVQAAAKKSGQTFSKYARNVLLETA
jgi:hypothetical protein